jgi:hypothetical protein
MSSSGSDSPHQAYTGRRLFAAPASKAAKPAQEPHADIVESATAVMEECTQHQPQDPPRIDIPLPAAYLIAPRCITDIHDVVTLAVSLSRKITRFDFRETILALTAAACVFHLDDDDTAPLACTLCKAYRATQRHAPGSPLAPPHLPSIIHQANGLRKNIAWLRDAINPRDWTETNAMGTWVRKRAAIIRAIGAGSAPAGAAATDDDRQGKASGQIDRALTSLISAASGVEEELKQRGKHRMAVDNLCRGFTSCTVFAASGMVAVPQAQMTRSLVSGQKQQSGTAKRGRKRKEKSTPYKDACENLGAKLRQRLAAQQPQPAAAAVGEGNGEANPRVTRAPMAQKTLTLLHALFDSNEDMCRVINACCCLLAVGHATTGHLRIRNLLPGLWGRAASREDHVHSQLSPERTEFAQRLSQVVNAATATRDDKTSPADEHAYIGDCKSWVLAGESCCPKNNYNEPCATMSCMGFKVDSELKPIVVQKIRSVLVERALDHKGPVPMRAWNLVLPPFVSSVIEIFHDYVVDRFVEAQKSEFSNQECRINAVMDRVRADRSTFMQQTADYHHHGCVDDKVAKAELTAVLFELFRRDDP